MVYQRKNTLVRQREIVDAARKLIIRHGSEHVTARRIAEEIGISEGAIYRHFKSKRDILSLLIDNIEDNLIGDIQKSDTPGVTPLGRLDGVLRSHLSSIEKRRGVSFQVIAEIVSLGDKKLNVKISETINNYISQLKNLIAEGVKAGEVREDIDLEAMATLLFSMIQGLVNIWALANYSFNAEEKYLPIWSVFRQAIIRR
jgi:AcrR family transcriptional regulator